GPTEKPVIVVESYECGTLLQERHINFVQNCLGDKSRSSRAHGKSDFGESKQCPPQSFKEVTVCARSLQGMHGSVDRDIAIEVADVRLSDERHLSMTEEFRSLCLKCVEAVLWIPEISINSGESETMYYSLRCRDSCSFRSWPEFEC